MLKIIDNLKKVSRKQVADQKTTELIHFRPWISVCKDNINTYIKEREKKEGGGERYQSQDEKRSDKGK